MIKKELNKIVLFFQNFSAIADMSKQPLWEKKSINVNGKILNCLKFADDIIIVPVPCEEINGILKKIMQVAIRR